MRCLPCLRFLPVLLTLGLTAAINTPSQADDTILLSIGPRVGFSATTPLLGKEQKYVFYLVDVAAVFRLPWSWQLGESPWNLETRLLTSAGVLTGASEKSLMMTVVPGIALSGWKGLVAVDIGGGTALLSNYKFGTQDFGGPAQLVGTVGVRVSPIAHAYAGFRAQHFSDAGLYGSSSLGVDMYIIEVGYRF